MSIERSQIEDGEARFDHSCGASHTGYHHEAFFYAGDGEFMAGVLPFIRDSLSADEPILVVLDSAKIAALRNELEGDSERVLFGDMAEVGSNPARIIPAWQDFVDRHAAPGRRIRGVGESVWAGRSTAELAERRRHEELLNVVFSDPEFSLLCPYDTTALDRAVVDDARRSHPFVREDGMSAKSQSFLGAEALAAPFDDPLPDPPADPPALPFGIGGLRDARSWVATRAAAEGLPGDRTPDLLLAFNEVATNSLTYGGGGGTVRVWRDGDAVVCGVRDAGESRTRSPVTADRTGTPRGVEACGLPTSSATWWRCERFRPARSCGSTCPSAPKSVRRRMVYRERRPNS